MSSVVAKSTISLNKEMDSLGDVPVTGLLFSKTKDVSVPGPLHGAVVAKDPDADAEILRPRVYLKPRIFRINRATNKIIDFRKDEEVNPVNEVRRMKRENIPDLSASPKVQKIGIFWTTSNASKRKVDRLTALLTFYSKERLAKMFVPIISVTSKISLRALDWLVINYSKKHKVVLVNQHSNIVNVYDDYRAWLKYWKRPLFDAFRRGPRIYFDFHGYAYSTTVAQLNFLYWADRCGVLEYANAHIDEIEKDMNARLSECRKEKAAIKLAGGKRKRSELSKAPHVKCLVYKVPCTIHF